MPITVTPITVPELTDVEVDGDGVFDKLMQAVKAHLEQEFKQTRLKGPEYASVYLGSLQAVLNTSLAFLLGKDKATLEAELIQAQVALAEKQIEKATQEILLVQAQIALAQQQAENLELEAVNIPKQGALLDAQAAKVAQETINLVSEELRIDAQTSLITQQEANAVIEGTVLTAQECKLRAEFDLIVANTLKSAQENALLAQKVVTERAQTQATGVDGDSVIGKQKALYQAQTDGFTRDAEQKTAKVMIDTWNVRRTTDEATQANATNKLSDTEVGRAVTKMLDGVGA